METQASTSPRYLQALPTPVEDPSRHSHISRSNTVVPHFGGKEVRQKSETKLDVPHGHAQKKPKADKDKPLESRHTKKSDDKTKHPKHSTKDKDKKHKDTSKSSLFGESHFGIRDNLSKGFHHIFQLLGLDTPKANPGNEAEAIQATIQNAGHTSPLLIVNNALFHLVNTIDNRFFGDKIPDATVNKVRDTVGKIVEHINLNTLPSILSASQKPSSETGALQAPPSLQDVINANKQDGSIAQALPKALEALTGVTGLKPKSLGLGDKVQLAFNGAKMNLVKGIELIKEILKKDFHLGTLLLDLIPHFAKPSFGEHKAELPEIAALN